jgi:uncharacterized membrane protein
MNKNTVWSGIVLVLLMGNPAWGELQFHDLGNLGGNIPMCDPGEISADGQTVVGRSFAPTGRHVFMWTPGAGMTGLDYGAADGVLQSRAYDVSADGRHIVGMRKLNDQMTQTITWVDGVMQDPFEAVSYSSGYAISDDANVIVLTDMRPDPADGNTVKGMTVLWHNPFEIAASYVEVLPVWDPGYPLPPHSLSGSMPFNISGDGGTVVGISLTVQARNAVRWYRESNEWQVASFWEYPDSESTFAFGATHDGSVIVGTYSTVMMVDGQEKSVWRAFRWSGGEPVELPPLDGHESSQANDISGDGSMIVGVSYTDATGSKAVYWDSDGAVHDLNTEEGLVLPEGVALEQVAAVSHDGTCLTGTGTSYSGGIGWYISGLRPGDPFEGAEDLDNGWSVSETFGYFWRAGKSHVWHAEHGWQYVPKGNSDSILVYDFGIREWVWENEQTYPYMYLYDMDPSWMWYAKGCEPGERFFFHYKKGKWVTEAELRDQ